MNDELYEKIKVEVEGIMASARIKLIDGLDFSEIAQLVRETVEAFVRVVAAVRENPADIKATVLGLCGKFYDEVIAPLDIPQIPDWLERGVVDPTCKQVFLAMIEAFLDYVIVAVQSEGTVTS